MSLRDAPPPGAAVEIAAGHVSAVSLESHGGTMAVAAHAAEALPEGALVPSLTARNLQNRAAVAAALRRVLEQVGRPRRVGLVVADAVARISLVRFEQVPSRQRDLEQLVRWQVRKAVPFAPEEAQVSYVAGLRGADGQEFVVTTARREIVLEYEEVCEAAGAHAGIVDISTFNVINAVLAGSAAPTGDWLLVNVAAASVSIAIMRDAHLIFFRSRGADADDTLADLVHQTAMYYEDRLQGARFGRVLLAGASTAAGRQAADVEWIRRNLEERLATSVDTVDPRAAVALTDRIAAAPALLDTLTPLVGLLLRGREAAA
jgi:type IV pilus assembly protein PilM